MNHEGVNGDTVPSCHWPFWREKFCNKIKEFPDSFVKKLEVCTMTDLHSTVPLTQGTVPGASF